jgi:hypothetical protein
LSNVVIAYCNETWWLVRGESHLQEMLQAKESPELEIALITCGAFAEVIKLWEQPVFGKMPWAINPKIVERLKSRERTTVT